MQSSLLKHFDIDVEEFITAEWLQVARLGRSQHLVHVTTIVSCVKQELLEASVLQSLQQTQHLQNRGRCCTTTSTYAQALAEHAFDISVALPPGTD